MVTHGVVFKNVRSRMGAHGVIEAGRTFEFEEADVVVTVVVLVVQRYHLFHFGPVNVATAVVVGVVVFVHISNPQGNVVQTGVFVRLHITHLFVPWNRK